MPCMTIVKLGSCSSPLKFLNSTLKDSIQKQKEQSWCYNLSAPPPPTTTFKSKWNDRFHSHSAQKPNERYLYDFLDDFKMTFQISFQITFWMIFWMYKVCVLDLFQLEDDLEVQYNWTRSNTHTLPFKLQ